MTEHVYEESDGNEVIELLESNGIECKLIGTLPSDHDIDVWVNKSTAPHGDPIAVIGMILRAKKVILTDMPSLFYLSHIFGHVDVFFEMPKGEKSRWHRFKERLFE